MPMVMVAGIAFRAIYLRRLLERIDHSVIETWPMGVYRAIARRTAEGADEGTGDDWRANLLSRAVDDLDVALDGNPGALRDQLDAVAAAYAGWLWCAGDAVAVNGDDANEGEIWIPAQEGDSEHE